MESSRDLSIDMIISLCPGFIPKTGAGPKTGVSFYGVPTQTLQILKIEAWHSEILVDLRKESVYGFVDGNSSRGVGPLRSVAAWQCLKLCETFHEHASFNILWTSCRSEIHHKMSPRAQLTPTWTPRSALRGGADNRTAARIEIVNYKELARLKS